MDTAQLNQTKRAALIKLSKCRTKVSKIGSKPERQDDLRMALAEYDSLHAAYHEAHDALLDKIEDEEELSKAILKFAEHDASSLHFRSLAESWLPRPTPTASEDIFEDCKDDIPSLTQGSADLSLPPPMDPRPPPPTQDQAPIAPKPDVKPKRLFTPSPTAPLPQPIGQHPQQHQFAHAESQPATLHELLATLSLPQGEVPPFSGDPMDYHAFMNAFRSRIVSKTSNAADLLYYLHQYVRGEARECILGCLQMSPEAGFSEALALLENEYGNPYRISCAYTDKISRWGPIKADDQVGLKAFHSFLNSIACYERRARFANSRSLV